MRGMGIAVVVGLLLVPAADALSAAATPPPAIESGRASVELHATFTPSSTGPAYLKALPLDGNPLVASPGVAAWPWRTTLVGPGGTSDLGVSDGSSIVELGNLEAGTRYALRFDVTLPSTVDVGEHRLDIAVAERNQGAAAGRGGTLDRSVALTFRLPIVAATLPTPTPLDSTIPGVPSQPPAPEGSAPVQDVGPADVGPAAVIAPWWFFLLVGATLLVAILMAWSATRRSRGDPPPRRRPHDADPRRLRTAPRGRRIEWQAEAPPLHFHGGAERSYGPGPAQASAPPQPPSSPQAPPGSMPWAYPPWAYAWPPPWAWGPWGAPPGSPPAEPASEHGPAHARPKREPRPDDLRALTEALDALRREVAELKAERTREDDV